MSNTVTASFPEECGRMRTRSDWEMGKVTLDQSRRKPSTAFSSKTLSRSATLLPSRSTETGQDDSCLEPASPAFKSLVAHTSKSFEEDSSFLNLSKSQATTALRDHDKTFQLKRVEDRCGDEASSRKQPTARTRKVRSPAALKVFLGS